MVEQPNEIIMTSARNILHVLNRYKMLLNDIDDYWMSMSDEWDLNIYTDDGRLPYKGTLYPCEGGMTRTDHPFPVEL